MRRQLAELVQPVIEFGLKLKERLESGQPLVLETEQAILKGMLLSATEARRLIDFGGERGRDAKTHGQSSAADTGSDKSEQFLGVRYALVCWLDELFILDSPWESKWNERKLEAALYGTNDRAWKFWAQANQAESRPGSDSLEVFLLCVMLGFRGQLRERPDRLKTWITSTKSRILSSLRRSWEYPPELDPPTHVPPLHGGERFHKILIRVGVCTLTLIPVVMYAIVRRLGI